MAQCIRVLTTKPNDLSLILSIPRIVQYKTNSCQLSSGLHACCGLLVYMHAQIDK